MGKKPKVQNQSPSSPQSNQNRSDDVERMKRLSKCFSMVHVALAVVVTVFSIVSLILIQLTDTSSEVFEKIAEYNGMSNFITVITGVIGMAVWSSPSPKKYIVKAHLIMLTVTVAALCTYLNYCVFNLVKMAIGVLRKPQPPPTEPPRKVGVDYGYVIGSSDGSGYEEDPFSSDPKFFETLFEKHKYEVIAYLVCELLIIIIWFVQSNNLINYQT